MRPTTDKRLNMSQPDFLHKSVELASYLKGLNISQLKKVMKVSDKLASEIQHTFSEWSTDSENTGLAVLSFRGDVYSGLQVDDFSIEDFEYANDKLRIVSGLYGILRPLDGVSPYRVEMGYRFDKTPYNNLYNFWSNELANTLSKDELIINLTSDEYGRAVLPYISKERIITPHFLTYSKTKEEYSNVAVHSKIARGAFANWLIKSRIDNKSELPKFSSLGYRYSNKLSTENNPVFVCDVFGGKGLSVRLK